VLIVVFSIILYQTIKTSIYGDATTDLAKYAALVERDMPTSYVAKSYTITHSALPSDIIARVVLDSNRPRSKEFSQFSHNGNHYLSIQVPLWFQSNAFLTLTQDMETTNKMLERILRDILLINLSAIVLILFYALFLSRMMLVPIKILTKKLSSMNEGFLKTVDTSTLPQEFLPLGNGINHLIKRIQTFVKYQKELFIGTAHELKTPLAVMKTKNEVTLLKKRECERYIEALKNNITAVNEMNAMIGAILEIGRQEGAQFEEPVEIEMVDFLHQRLNDFRILAHQEGKNINEIIDFEQCTIQTQPTLLVHILQNFVQNALKFSKEKADITVHAFIDKDGLHIEVKDEGKGIDESKDLFAPFKRYGDKAGTGLGLFLAKGAAQALGAQIDIANRKDRQGAVATLILPINQDSKL
jgi:two-component system OmpR family sensor kinase